MSVRRGKPKTSRSLAATLAITFLALTVAALLVANLSVFFFFGQAIQESVNSRQQLTAKEAANTVASFVQEKFSELEATVKIGEPTLASQEEQRNTLGNLLGLVPAFRQLILFNAQDQALVQVSRLSEAASGRLTEQVGRDLFLQSRQGDRYISPVYVDDVTSEPLVIMAVPATDAFGDFQGTLLAEVNLKFMWDLVDRLQVGETGVAYVVDKQGNLLAFGDISRVLRGENVGQLEVVGEFMRNPVPAGEAATSMVRGINGTTVVGTYVPLGTPDWAVVAELPLAEAFQPGIQSSVILGIVMLVVTALVGLAAVYVARRLAAPLLDLTATAGRIAAGETQLQAALEGPAEVVDLARAFNSMTAQLRELIGSLELQVADRTRNLLAAAEVARATTSVLDPDELLRQTVGLVRERLDLYYVGLFLLGEEAGDTDRTFAVLRAGTGEAGQQMMAGGHRLEVGGDSMIGQCVARGQASIALDVGKEAVHFDNPLLPDTRSEMALPLVSRGRVIGAMTVQDTREAAFDEADIAVMQTMADQVAVAIDNARLFAETQAALHEMETIHQHYLGRTWAEYSRARATSGYQQSEIGLVPLGDEILPETWQVMVAPGTAEAPQMAEAPQTTAAPEHEEAEGDGDSDHRPELSPAPALVTPLRLRGRPIGALGFRQAEGRRSWTEEEIELVQAIAQDFALAADNIRLVEDTQRRAIRERLTSEVAARMRQTLDLETVVRTAAQEMGQALNAHELTIRLQMDEDKSE
jgi:GAF domain-containing protein/HAMP domain-containing protein